MMVGYHWPENWSLLSESAVPTMRPEIGVVAGTEVALPQMAETHHARVPFLEWSANHFRPLQVAEGQGRRYMLEMGTRRGRSQTPREARLMATGECHLDGAVVIVFAVGAPGPLSRLEVGIWSAFLETRVWTSEWKVNCPLKPMGPGRTSKIHRSWRKIGYCTVSRLTY